MGNKPDIGADVIIVQHKRYVFSKPYIGGFSTSIGFLNAM
jgi:hypothetical protein